MNSDSDYQAMTSGASPATQPPRGRLPLPRFQPPTGPRAGPRVVPIIAPHLRMFVLKIAVCLKRVPDTVAKITIGADRKSIDESGLKFVPNPYDEFAIEEAIAL